MITPNPAGEGRPGRWLHVRVGGPSMTPTVRNGDRLLVRTVRAGEPVAAGAVVLARFPAAPQLLVVKRVEHAVPGGHWVRSDNPFAPGDSRQHGTAVVVGVVRARVWPRPGRLPGPPPV